MPKPSVKRSVKIRVKRRQSPDERPAVQVSLGCHLQGAACPHPDPSHTDTMIAGVCKRFASETPQVDGVKLERLRIYVNNYVQRFKPLDPATDLTVETWLEKTSYPAWRKQELLDAWNNCPDPWDPKYWKNDGFMKDETYVDYKHARGINSRSDVFKCLTGPIFHAIEEVLYSEEPAFIKHVPVKDRPDYIYNHLYKPGAGYGQSDFETFEALFVKPIMCAVEMPMYFHFIQNIPQADRFRRVLQGALTGINVTKYRDFIVELLATRMSGDMCTSLGNGWSNLMFNGFMASECGCTHFAGVVEGDDGLFSFEGGRKPTRGDYESIGLKIKLEFVDDLSKASFCGIVFSLKDRNNLADPWKVLANFGWTSQRYEKARPEVLKALLRAKALSLAHAYPGAPVIQELAHFGLRATSDVRMCKLLRVLNGRKAMSQWMRDWVLSAIDAGVPERREVGIDSRLLVEEVFGVTVQQQLRLESYLAGKQDLTPIVVPLDGAPASWMHYWDAYVVGRGSGAPQRSTWKLDDVLAWEGACWVARTP